MPVFSMTAIYGGTYTLSDFQCLLAVWLCCLEVSCLPVEHREVVVRGGNSRMGEAKHLLSDLQGVLQDSSGFL